MLSATLYTIKSFGLSDNRDKINCTIMLKSDHAVFSGHFPGNPILPGVCTVQIIKEILEKALEGSLLLTSAGMIKYLGFVNPLKAPELSFDLTITGNAYCHAIVTANDTIVCNFRGEFREMV